MDHFHTCTKLCSIRHTCTQQSEDLHSVSRIKCTVKWLWQRKRNPCIIEHIWASGPVSSILPHLHPVWTRRRVDLHPTFCHWLRLWQSAIPKLNTVLLISQRLPAKCAASISLLTSFHRYDRFSDASFAPSFIVKPFTDSHTSICTRSFPHQTLHTQNHFQTNKSSTGTHIHMQGLLKWNWNESAITVSISIYSILWKERPIVITSNSVCSNKGQHSHHSSLHFLLFSTHSAFYCWIPATQYQRQSIFYHTKDLWGLSISFSNNAVQEYGLN